MKRSLPVPGAPLSGCEQAVANLVTEGLTNDEIAAKLYRSSATIKTHLHRIMIKAGARNRAHLAAIYASQGRCRTAPGIIVLLRQRRGLIEQYRPKHGTPEYFYREGQLKLIDALVYEIEQMEEPV